jgi:toxin ParE1/3/4
MLHDHPYAGRAREEVRPGLRSVASGPYVIFYRVHHGVAELVRILDGRRDIDEIFD